MGTTTQFEMSVVVDMSRDLNGMIALIADRHGVNSKCHKLIQKKSGYFRQFTFKFFRTVSSKVFVSVLHTM